MFVSFCRLMLIGGVCALLLFFACVCVLSVRVLFGCCCLVLVCLLSCLFECGVPVFVSALMCVCLVSLVLRVLFIVCVFGFVYV